MARKTKEEAQKTRETILMAALDMFCEKGYTRTTFDEIAKRINLTKGAVYWHFKNKPDILKALIIEAFEHNETVLKERISEINTLDDMQQYFCHAAELLQNTPVFRKFLFFVMYQMEWSEGLFNTLNLSGPINHIMNHHQKLISGVLQKSLCAGEISPDTDIMTATRILQALWEGILHLAVSKNYEGDFLSLTEKSFQLIIKSLKTKKDN